MSEPQSEPASTEPTPTTMTPEEVAASNIPPDPPPVDNEHVADGATPFSDAAEPEHAAMSPLARIEELAIRFGGDAMTEIRHLVAEVRSLL